MRHNQANLTARQLAVNFGRPTIAMRQETARAEHYAAVEKKESLLAAALTGTSNLVAIALKKKEEIKAEAAEEKAFIEESRPNIFKRMGSMFDRLKQQIERKRQ